MGLALIIYSFAGAVSKMSAQMENVAILVMALLVPVYNIGSVIVLLASRHRLTISSSFVILAIVKFLSNLIFNAEIVNSII